MRPFAQVFASLGVQVDFTRAIERVIGVDNKPGRVDTLAEQIEGLLLANPPKVGFKDALSLRSRMVYAEGQLFGRVTATAARILSEWARFFGAREATPELAEALIRGGGKGQY